MKKLAIIAMALMVALAVTACSNNTQNSSSSTPEQSSSQTEQSSSEESSSEAEQASGDLDENISQPPTGAEDEPEEEISSDKVTPEE